MSRALSVARNRFVAAWLARTGQREFIHIGDFGFRILAPWARVWPEDAGWRSDLDPLPWEIAVGHGWR